MQEDNILTCKRDAEEAIDDFLFIHETFPILEGNENGICRYCQKPSDYRLVLPVSMKHQEYNNSKELEDEFI